MDIGTWLHRLGTQQYELAFRENAIDATVLSELTADDLKDLGVSLVGHRRKLLAAIAALRVVSAAPLAWRQRWSEHLLWGATGDAAAVRRSIG
jgi:hypothetical protein